MQLGWDVEYSLENDCSTDSAGRNSVKYLLFCKFSDANLKFVEYIIIERVDNDA